VTPDGGAAGVNVWLDTQVGMGRPPIFSTLTIDLNEDEFGRIEKW